MPSLFISRCSTAYWKIIFFSSFLVTGEVVPCIYKLNKLNYQLKCQFFLRFLSHSSPSFKFIYSQTNFSILEIFSFKLLTCFFPLPSQISDINEFYKYLRNSLLPTLKPDFWYGPFDDPVSKVTTDKGDIYALSSPGPNGTKVYSRVYPYPKGYTADRANAWLVGIPRIRQLRVIDGKYQAWEAAKPTRTSASPLYFYPN